MTRTAISPRLAMRTFLSTLRLSTRIGPASAWHGSVGMACHVRRSAFEVRRFAELDSTNRYLLRRGPAGALRGDWWPWPTTRAPGGGAWAGAGRPRPGRGLLVLGAPATRRCRAGRLHLCDRRRWPWPRPTPAAWPASAPASSGPTTWSSASASWPGSWPRPTSAAAGGLRVGGRGGGDRGQRHLARAAGGRGDLAGRGGRAPGRPRGPLLDALLAALVPRAGALDSPRGRRRGGWPRTPRPLRRRSDGGCGSSSAGEDGRSGAAVGPRRTDGHLRRRRGRRAPRRSRPGDVVHLRPR